MIICNEMLQVKLESSLCACPSKPQLLLPRGTLVDLSWDVRILSELIEYLKSASYAILLTLNECQELNPLLQMTWCCMKLLK